LALAEHGKSSVVRRFRHVVLILMGKAPYEFSTERMELFMALENFNAKVAELNEAAQRVIGQLQASEQSSAHATSDLANADQTATAAIQPIVDALNAAIPPVPADAPQSEVSAAPDQAPE
jgi:hypothetical protein